MVALQAPVRTVEDDSKYVKFSEVLDPQPNVTAKIIIGFINGFHHL